MGMINGKLINQKTNQFDEITQNIQYINQRCEYLQSQLTHISSQDNLQYLQKLEQRIGFLEKVTSKQSKQISFIKISSIIALLFVWSICSMNNQSEDDNSQLQTQAHPKLVKVL
ncbi:MAG: hypothetical protein HC836_33400 [Richelia sp. RM2_1_2]|nr:hypothetical protein [Richelia sp. SM1_7_0]NJN11460.1 hypothetical protein [Richelia sp. RM1_1_1]NJO30587.1 hypothetical protein [Richelia sp. SL_2_1]NJO62945.1 hypothetical protein [Richelia sp. RM2_1_2]